MPVHERRGLARVAAYRVGLGRNVVAFKLHAVHFIHDHVALCAEPYKLGERRALAGQSVELALVGELFLLGGHFVRVLLGCVARGVGRIRGHVYFVLILNRLPRFILYFVDLYRLAVVRHYVVGGVVQKRKVVIVSAVIGVVGGYLLYAVAAYRPAVIKPPLGEISVTVFVTERVAHVVLHVRRAGVGLLPAHGDLIVEIQLIAHFEKALLLYGVITEPQIGFRVAAVVLAAVVKRLQSVLADA